MHALWQRRAILGRTLALGLVAPRAASAENERYVRIATGSVTGTYYPIASLLANVLSRPPGARICSELGACGVPDLILVVEASKGSVANVEADGGSHGSWVSCANTMNGPQIAWPVGASPGASDGSRRADRTAR